MVDPDLRVGKIRRACTEAKFKLTMNSPLMLRRNGKSGVQATNNEIIS